MEPLLTLKLLEQRQGVERIRHLFSEKSNVWDSGSIREWLLSLQIYHVESGLKRCFSHPAVEGQNVRRLARKRQREM
jgi:hypothetical protein